jgi:hypothetical protein
MIIHEKINEEDWEGNDYVLHEEMSWHVWRE